MRDIQTVVHQCQNGHLDAFTALFNHYQHRVYDLACTILRDEETAEDVVQDTFLAVFHKIDSFKGESTFETWLMAITVNQCRTRQRKQKVRQFLSLERLSPRRLFRVGGRNDDVADIVHTRQPCLRLLDQPGHRPGNLGAARLGFSSASGREGGFVSSNFITSAIARSSWASKPAA